MQSRLEPTSDNPVTSFAQDFSNTIKAFGAVPVTPTNFYRLLQVTGTSD